MPLANAIVRPQRDVATCGPILAIDPGHTESAWVLLTDGKPAEYGKWPNEKLLAELIDSDLGSLPTLVIEQIASFGMSVGAEIFETVFWTGRFSQAWEANGGKWNRLKRQPVKLHLCNSVRAKDGNVRQALIDRFGGPDKAIGAVKCGACNGRGSTKKVPCVVCGTSGWKYPPGPLKGISADVWQALAVAVAWADGVRNKAEAVQS